MNPMWFNRFFAFLGMSGRESPASPPHRSIYPSQLLDRNIRILILLPGETTELIECQLVTLSLDDPLEYEAISYVWGDPKIRESIRCDGITMEGTVNLVNVLWRLRRPIAARLLWADAVCINQADVIERNHQVGLMRDVFNGARMVLIWLGDDECGEAKRLFGFMKLLYRLLEQHGPTSGMHFTNAYPSMTLDVIVRNLEYQKCDYASVIERPVFAPAPDILNRPWFRRIWCVQEYAVARDQMFICGDEEIEGKKVVEFIMWGNAGQTEPGSDTEGVHSILAASPFFRLLQGLDLFNPSLAEALGNFSAWEASDPRDKILALLPIVGRWIEVDYENPIAEVFFRGSYQFNRALRGSVNPSVRGSWPGIPSPRGRTILGPAMG